MSSHGLGTPSISYRQFYEILEEKEREGVLLAQRNPRMPDLLQKIQDSLVGRFQGFDSPLGGLKPIVYADWTASGRALHFIEDFLRTEVMPWYGNTHTTTSITGSQTTHYRHEARQIIAESLNARISGKAADDVVLFCGSGSTSAVTKMVHVLGLNRPLAPGTPDSQRPVVFVGPYSHHSNLLPWRESCAEVVAIAGCPMSGVDFIQLEKVLKQYANRPLKIGSFTAASNITGICVDVDAVTALLHKYGALAFWDYATAAPYIKVDMNPVSYPIRLGGASSSTMAQDDSDDEEDSALQRPNLSKDAIFISGHKFVGGPGTPGVLVVKKRLLDNSVPQSPGGGTVFFVTQEDHRYLSNREEREEGGTPDIVGSIRLGLCFRLKDTVGAEYAKEREALFAKKTLESFCSNKNIVVLGDFKTPRLPIFSFLIRYGGSFLHYNFVAALLNDLFGIQSRGGCQCAGPYGQQLLGLTMEDNRAYEKALLDKLEILRPGFTRFSLTYYHSDAEVDYIISAVHHVADHGYKFLPHYRFNHKTGEWRHTSRFTRFPNRKWLSNFDFERLPIPEKVGLQNWDVETELELFSKVMSDVEGLTEAAETSVGKLALEESDLMGPEYESLRWFVYPSEVGQDLAKSGRTSTPFPGRLKPIQCTIEHESPRYHYRDFIKETLGSSPYSSGRSSPADSPLLNGHNGHGHSHSQPGARGGLLSPGFECRELKLIRQQQQRSPYQPQRIQGSPYAPTGSPYAPIGSPYGPMGSPYAPNPAGLRDLGGGARILTASGQPNNKRPSHNQMDKLTANLKRFATFGRPPGASPTRDQPSSGRGQSLGRKPDTITYFKNEGQRGEPNKTQQGRAQEGENMMEVDEGSHMAESALPSSTSVQVAETKTSNTPPPPPVISTDGDSSDEDDSPAPKSSRSIVGTTNGDSKAPVCVGPACSLQTRPSQPVDAHKYPLRKGGLENAPAYTIMEQRFASLPHKQLFPKAPAKLLKVVGQAIRDWDMIQEGDRLCLGLSGGKDSLTLLHILLDLQKRAPVRFTIAAATVDPQTPSFDPRSLIPYMKALGVEYHFLSQPIIDQAKKSIRGDSLCAFCSRFKRGILYTCCQQNGYNKLVLAQHLDDLAESLFMSMLHNGQVRTMKANYVGEKGIRVIRPLVYARESATKAFAQNHVLPIINENCPACFEQPKERQRVKEMLAKEESLYPRMFDSLRSAMVPLMDDQIYDVMKGKLEAMEKQKLQHWEERKSRGQGRKEEARLRRNDGAKMDEEEEEEKGGKVFGQTTMVLDEDDDDEIATGKSSGASASSSSVVGDDHVRAALQV